MFRILGITPGGPSSGAIHVQERIEKSILTILKRGGETAAVVSYVVRVVLPVLPIWPASPEYVAVIVTVIDLPGFV